MAYNTDPNNKETNRQLEKMGKDIDNAQNSLVWWAIMISALLIGYMLLNPIK